ncbi:MAG: NAD(P)H-binding protein [Pseudomonadota bacterium]
MSSVIILGAKGRFGRAATDAFLQAGWDVSTFGRNWDAGPRAGVHRVSGDVKDTETLIAAVAGRDVIVNAINPPYHHWRRELPKITKSVIRAAQHTGAAVLIPGNVYNYGADAPVDYREDTPWRPSTRKGKLRVEMENAYRDAAVRTIVVRAGDYIERAKSDSWFDRIIAAQARQGRTVYPGPLDQVHAWGYLPDVARAAVHLAARRAEMPIFDEFGVEGFSLTGQQLVDEIARATGKAQRVGRVPWGAIKCLGLFQPFMREVLEMRYLWNVPHRMDQRKLEQFLPGFQATPVAAVMQHVLAP